MTSTTVARAALFLVSLASWIAFEAAGGDILWGALGAICGTAFGLWAIAQSDVSDS